MNKIATAPLPESQAREILGNYKVELEAKLVETGEHVSRAMQVLKHRHVRRSEALALHQAAQLAAIAAEQFYRKVERYEANR